MIEIGSRVKTCSGEYGEIIMTYVTDNRVLYSILLDSGYYIELYNNQITMNAIDNELMIDDYSKD